MFEWLPWLFLGALAFFGLGWLVARIDIRQLLLESRAMPQAYFRGLNFLLNEQQDKAIESFMEVTQANPAAVELQFAIGSLFRRRGEVDRAIRVHQDISERDGVSVGHRTDALLELAIDYQKAGLLDHAQQILGDLSARQAGSRAQQEQALKLLLAIHVQERNWQSAIDVALRLHAGEADDRISAARMREIAHYHCELAVIAHGQANAGQAAQHLQDALAVNAKCIRANLLRGEWLAAAGDHAGAIAEWRKIEAQDPAYLGLMAEPLLSSYETIGNAKEGLEVLRKLQRQYPVLDLLTALFRATLESEGPDAARDLVKDELRRTPTLAGLDRLLEAQLLSVPAESREDMQVLKDLVHSHAQRLAVYLCGNCGFKARQFHWQCPACGGWETFPPRQTAEYDISERRLVRAQAKDKQPAEKATSQ